jgi:hypothetical protein
MRLSRAAANSKSEIPSRSVREKTELSFLMLKSTSRVGLSRLRRPLSLASVLALLTVLTLSGATAVHATTSGNWTSSGWVSNVSIQDLTGNQVVATNEALLAGHAYNLTLQISVPSTLPTTFDVSLNNLIGPASGQSVYWAVHNPSYPGYTRAAFTGGVKTVTMNYTAGTVKMSAYFEIPVNFTNPIAKYTSPSGNGTLSLNLPQPVTFVSVVPYSGTSTGSFSATVEDQTIQLYQTDYNQTSALVPSGKIPSTYSSLVNSILGEAQALNTLGLPDQGTKLLGALVPSAFPTPPNNSLTTDLEVGLAAAAVVVVLLAVLMLRSKGRSGYSTGIINDVQKDLAILEVTAAKYDRAMADKLKSLRDKLSESS